MYVSVEAGLHNRALDVLTLGVSLSDNSERVFRSVVNVIEMNDVNVRSDATFRNDAGIGVSIEERAMADILISCVAQTLGFSPSQAGTVERGIKNISPFRREVETKHRR